MRVAEEDGAGDRDLDPLRGRALYQLGLYDQSEALLERAIAQDGQDPRSWRTLGLVLADTARPDAAIEAFETALELDDQHAATWNNLGFLLFAVKQDPACIDALTRAVTLDAKNDRFRRNLAFALFEHGNRDQAWSAFQAADAPADAWYHYGLAFERVEELDEARQRYEETLQIAPDHTRAREALQRIAAFGPHQEAPCPPAFPGSPAWPSACPPAATP